LSRQTSLVRSSCLIAVRTKITETCYQSFGPILIAPSIDMGVPSLPGCRAAGLLGCWAGLGLDDLSIWTTPMPDPQHDSTHVVYDTNPWAPVDVLFFLLSFYLSCSLKLRLLCPTLLFPGVLAGVSWTFVPWFVLFSALASCSHFDIIPGIDA
jgi:hypothetical protein